MTSWPIGASKRCSEPPLRCRASRSVPSFRTEIYAATDIFDCVCSEQPVLAWGGMRIARPTPARGLASEFGTTSPAQMAFQLATLRVGGEAPKHSAVILHGALGSGQNFRSFASKLARLRSDYAFLLPDLRHHGQSRPAPPPDTLAACAQDVVRLVQSAAEPDRAPVRVVIGHSLGGKVALQVARELEGVLAQVWVLDSNPGIQPLQADSEIQRVVSALSRVPMPLERRADVVPLLLERGLSAAIANWMTTNLERGADGYRWALDLERIQALLVDYSETDLWSYLDGRKQDRLDLHWVVAERSERLDQTVRDRLAQLEHQGKLRYHLLAKAGHWLHVDNPDDLLALLAESLPR